MLLTLGFRISTDFKTSCLIVILRFVFGLSDILLIRFIFDNGVALLRTFGVGIVLAEEPGVVAQIQTLARVVHLTHIVFGPKHNLVLFLARGKNLLKAELGHVVAVVDHLKAVQVLDDALDVEAPRWVAFKALHDDTVHYWVNRLLRVV